jgi:hypothetical protein
MKRFGFWRRFPCLLAAMTAISLPYAASAQSIATTPNSVIRPGALNDIPQHLAEIGWDTDVPSLFVIRFQPEKMNFDAGWSSWVTEAMLKRTGFMSRPRIDPWPPIFAGNGSFVSMNGGQLSPQDMQAFQAWCLRRSQVIPPIIVHAIPYVAPISGQSARLLPLGVQPGQPRASQTVVGVGFAGTIGLTLTHNADDDAVTVPPEVIAALPPMGVSLETRLRWSDPVPGDNPMTSAVVPVAMMVPGEPVSLRLVADRRVLWEHRYGAPAPASAAQPPQAKASPAPAPVGAPDIKF